VFLALGAERTEDPHREATETMELHPMPVHGTLAMAGRGEVKSGPSTIALLWSEPHLPRV
jgi:hypothetical protein